MAIALDRNAKWTIAGGFARRNASSLIKSPITASDAVTARGPTET